jgi:hypothetical protein
MSAALLYEMVAFAVVVFLVFFLRPPAPRDESGHAPAQPRPAPAQA